MLLADLCMRVLRARHLLRLEFGVTGLVGYKEVQKRLKSLLNPKRHRLALCSRSVLSYYRRGALTGMTKVLY